MLKFYAIMNDGSTKVITCGLTKLEAARIARIVFAKREVSSNG